MQNDNGERFAEMQYAQELRDERTHLANVERSILEDRYNRDRQTTLQGCPRPYPVYVQNFQTHLLSI